MTVVTSDTDSTASTCRCDSVFIADDDVAVAIDVALYKRGAGTDAVGVVYNIALWLTLASKPDAVYKWHRNAENQSEKLCFRSHVDFKLLNAKR